MADILVIDFISLLSVMLGMKTEYFVGNYI